MRNLIRIASLIALFVCALSRAEEMKLSVESYTVPAKDAGIELYVRSVPPI
jgi:hypothetical protein